MNTETDKPLVPSSLIHHLHAGRIACNKLGVPKDWPAHEAWSSDWQFVNCAKCRATNVHRQLCTCLGMCMGSALLGPGWVCALEVPVTAAPNVEAVRPLRPALEDDPQPQFGRYAVEIQRLQADNDRLREACRYALERLDDITSDECDVRSTLRDALARHATVCSKCAGQG